MHMKLPIFGAVYIEIENTWEKRYTPEIVNDYSHIGVIMLWVKCWSLVTWVLLCSGIA